MEEDFENSSIDSVKFLRTNILTAIFENSLFYPFEYLKTRQQALDVFASHPHALAPPHHQPLRSDLSKQPGMWSQAIHTVQTSGFRGLYRGFSWFAMANVPADVIYLYGYAMSKQTLMGTSFGQSHPTMAYMASGAMGDFFSIVLVVPLEVVAQRLQIQDARIRTYLDDVKAGRETHVGELPKVKNGFQIFHKIAREEGVRGLFKGTGMSLLLFLPSSAAWWGVSEATKKPAANFLGVSSENPLGHALAGSAAGFFTSLMMNPVDVVKTRLQTSITRTTAFRVTLDLALHGGILSFYRGITPRLMGSVPRSALGMVIYQFILSVSQTDESTKS